MFLPIELTPELLAQLKSNDVEEIRFVTGQNGVSITVNGEALPQIAWNSALPSTCA